MDTQPQKSSLKSEFTNLILFLLAFLGIALIVGGFYVDYRRKILSFYISPVVFENTPDHENLSKPVRMRIPEADIDITVEESEIKDGIWEISQESASYLKTSAKPGGGGNIVIYGHNKKQIFGNLIGRAEPGQIIEVFTEDGKNYTYEIEEVKTIKPTDIKAVSPTIYEVLTVYTCSGFLDSDRLVLKAKPTL